MICPKNSHSFPLCGDETFHFVISLCPLPPRTYEGTAVSQILHTETSKSKLSIFN